MEHLSRVPGVGERYQIDSCYAAEDRSCRSRHWLLLLVLIGCTQSVYQLAVPDAASIAIDCFYRENDGKSKVTTVATPQQRDRIVQALRDLRWSELGTPRAELAMRPPDLAIRLIDDAGTVHTYQLYWDSDSLLDQNSLRLPVGCNLTALRAEISATTGLTTFHTPHQPVIQPGSIP